MAQASADTRMLAGRAVWVLADDGPLLASDRAAADVIGEAFGTGARIVAIPASRLPPAFLDLSTRLAGEVIQKFVNYGFQVVFVGDISQPVAASHALRDFVRESNRGRHVWFVEDLAELAARLAA